MFTALAQFVFDSVRTNRWLYWPPGPMTGQVFSKEQCAADLKVYFERTPIPMVLHCPSCGAQHIDAPNPAIQWTNPPHRSHLCDQCKTVWRPSDLPTVGVLRIQSVGKADTWPLEPGMCDYYILAEPSAVYVKEGRFFESQGGLVCSWGTKWQKVQALSLTDAHRIGEQRR